MTIQFRKTTITLELLELWTPNKRHLVPYSQTNHLIPNLNSWDDAERKQQKKSLNFAKNG